MSAQRPQPNGNSSWDVRALAVVDSGANVSQRGSERNLVVAFWQWYTTKFDVSPASFPSPLESGNRSRRISRTVPS